MVQITANEIWLSILGALIKNIIGSDFVVGNRISGDDFALGLRDFRRYGRGV
jgi:hypothetical protein